MYNKTLKYKWDNKTMMDYAVAQAELKAREREQAKASEEKNEIASNFNNLGVPISDISKSTDLSIEEIKKL